jgi:SMC interacting uncharacterized protein involved in chromosome segregation
VSAKILTAPGPKDFQHIFKFLYARIDKEFSWDNRRFEDEVPSLVKGLKYGFQFVQ